MKPTLIRLMHWEWRRLSAERANLLLLAFWIGLVAVAAWQGTGMTRARHLEISVAQSADENLWQGKRARLVAIESGETMPGPFSDPRSPTHNVLVSTSDRPVVLWPAPLAAIAAGASEMAPAVKRSGTLTKVYVPPDSLENPANRLAGRFDLLFVVSALLPLFVLALSFDVLARERELRIWPLLASQPISPGRIVIGRLGLHFILLGLPLAVAATVAVFLSHSGEGPIAAAAPELLCWLLLAALYLVFWQALAAWINFRNLTAASSALALCGAWLALALLIPGLAQVAVRLTAPTPDRLGLVLAQRDAEIALHKNSETVRDEFYARYGYEPPQGELNEYDTFFVNNIVPRAFALDAEIKGALEEIERRREAQSRRAGQLAWLSPALAFRRATELLAAVSPVQQATLIREARSFQQQWRAHFGAKLSSMTPLSVQDYETKPEPPVVRFGLRERLASAWPSLLAVLVAALTAVGAVAWKKEPEVG